MVRSAVADEHLLSYITNLAKQNLFSAGLILGQSVAGKDYVIHLAKTPPCPTGDADETPLIRSINNVSEEWLADHARQATRMLPGGMYVLGVFTISTEDLLNPFSSKLKALVAKVQKQLDSNKYLFGNSDCSEKLVLNYCTSTKLFSCKSLDVITGGIKPAECKFMQSPTKWTQIECKYIMEQVYHIGAHEGDWPLKKHISIVLDRLNSALKSSVFLYDGQLHDVDDTIESIGKKKTSRNKNKEEAPIKPLQVCILQTCEIPERLFEVRDSGNQIRIFGHVSSKLWLQPKLSVKAASNAILEDIMRSLSARLEMHWDSLTEEEHGEDVNSVHEPPRRVLVPLPHSKIAISDYLFPGEGPQDAQNSLEELLDIKVGSVAEVVDAEGQADLTDYYNEGLDSESEDVMLKTPTAANKSLYFIGLGVGFLVLIISMLLHFMQQD